MIIEYDDAGRIWHIVKDPVPPGLTEEMAARGCRFISLPPKPWPPEPEIEPRTGLPRRDGNGEIVMSSQGMDFASCDMRRDYVRDGQITPRPECPATVSVAGRTVSIRGVPGGSSVRAIVDGVEVTVEDTVIEVDEPGALTIAIAPPWPYLEANHDLEIE